MKRLLLITVASLALSAPAWAANVGVSVTVGDPGFYGRIDIGGYPQPVLINPTPVFIGRAPLGSMPPPLYLHVPPGHMRNWPRYCARYNACGQPVYFVQDNWYNQVYVPRYRAGPQYHPHPQYRQPPWHREERFERREQRQDRREDRRDQRFDRSEGHRDNNR